MCVIVFHFLDFTVALFLFGAQVTSELIGSTNVSQSYFSTIWCALHNKMENKKGKPKKTKRSGTVVLAVVTALHCSLCEEEGLQKIQDTHTHTTLLCLFLKISFQVFLVWLKFKKKNKKKTIQEVRWWENVEVVSRMTRGKVYFNICHSSNFKSTVRL